jgi:hypothetical protein
VLGLIDTLLAIGRHRVDEVLAQLLQHRRSAGMSALAEADDRHHPAHDTVVA